MKRYALIFALLTILLLLTVSALAQDDATAVPTEDVPAETLEATADALETEQVIATQEVVVIVTQTPEQSPTPTLTPTPEMTATATAGTGGNSGSGGSETGSSGSVIVIVISILTLVLGGGTLVSMITNFRKDAAGVAATEALGKSVPQEVAMELVRLLSAAKEGAEIAIEALDNIPAAEKPPAIRNFTNEELIAEVQRRGYSITAG